MHQSRYVAGQKAKSGSDQRQSHVLRLKAQFGVFLHFNSKRGMMSQCCQGLLGPGRAAAIKGFAAGTGHP